MEKSRGSGIIETLIIIGQSRGKNGLTRFQLSGASSRGTKSRGWCGTGAMSAPALLTSDLFILSRKKRLSQFGDGFISVKRCVLYMSLRKARQSTLSLRFLPRP